MLSLVMAPLNVDFRIVRVKSLKNSNVTESHLANLGFVRGAIVKVLNENDGNLIVSIKGARVAIGKDIAKKIMVSGPLKRRIMDMGITKNSEIYIRKVAPLGDPVQINIRNYELSIRREDAELIEIEEVEKKEG